MGLNVKKPVSYGITVGRTSCVPVAGTCVECWLAAFCTAHTHIDFDGGVSRFQHEGFRRVEDPFDISILSPNIHDCRAQ
jgi:hypothetical protein